MSKNKHGDNITLQPVRFTRAELIALIDIEAKNQILCNVLNDIALSADIHIAGNYEIIKIVYKALGFTEKHLPIQSGELIEYFLEYVEDNQYSEDFAEYYYDWLVEQRQKIK